MMFRGNVVCTFSFFTDVKRETNDKHTNDHQTKEILEGGFSQLQ